MQNFRSFCPLGAVLWHPLSKNPDFARTMTCYLYFCELESTSNTMWSSTPLLQSDYIGFQNVYDFQTYLLKDFCHKHMSHLNSSNFHVSHLLTLLHHSLYKLKENSSLKSCISNIILFKEEKNLKSLRWCWCWWQWWWWQAVGIITLNRL